MWKFRNGNVFVLFFWTIYGPLVFDTRIAHAQHQQPVPGAQMISGLPAAVTAGAGERTAATAQAQQQQQQQPCDRTRRVFTETFGEISDGPAGSNYTQVSCSFTIQNMCRK